MRSQNPFTTTFSKLPEYTYISTAEPGEILENFSHDVPTEAVYKITGIRGSGKTVMMSYLYDEMTSADYAGMGWLTYTLNPNRDMLKQLAADLYHEPFIKESAKSTGLNLSAQILGSGGGIGFSRESDDRYFDIGVEIAKMLQTAQEKQKKILLCIDEVSKTPEMVVFALEFAGWLIAGYPVHVVCTGLYENVLALGNTKNLTFFRRGKTIETQPLNFIRMSEMYRTQLNLSPDDAQAMARITKGYAYAFQKLGSLYYQKKDHDTMDDLTEALKADLFAYSYEKIWEELSQEDRSLVSLLTEKPEYTREEVLKSMGEKSKNYPVYRDRLQKRGIITVRRGHIGLHPPFFADYVKVYGNVTG